MGGGEWVQENSGLGGGERRSPWPSCTAAGRSGDQCRSRSQPSSPRRASPGYSLARSSTCLHGNPLCLLVPVEGLKVVEIEKCKSDIKKMRDELAARSSR